MARRSQRKRRRSGAARSPLTLYVWGAVAAVLVVAAVVSIAVLSSSSDSAPSEIVVPTERPADIPTDGRVFGDPDAPVLVSEYLDFQCPFCRRASNEILPPIESEYVESGDARVEVHAIAILGEESVQAAAAAECANEQDRFWAFHDILFANQGAERSGAFSDERLKEMAAAIGLDTDAFDTCLDTGRYRSFVQGQTDDARTAGVGSTPSFLVDGRAVETGIGPIADAILEALD